MNRRGSLIATAAMCVLMTALVGGAAVPNRISYQGVLNDENGVPINGAVSFTFGLYTVSEGGSALWSEVQSVQVSNGVFSVELGAETALPASVFLNPDLYLGVRAGADQEMTPRQRVVSTAYVITAGQLSEPIQGEQLAKESVWPVHAGRDNTIVSYHARYTSNVWHDFNMPADKKFIITDIAYHRVGGSDQTWTSSCAIQYVKDGVKTILYQAVSSDSGEAPNKGQGHHDTFRAGLPVPAGATLQIGGLDGNQWSTKSCTVAGFEIPAE